MNDWTKRSPLFQNHSDKQLARIAKGKGKDARFAAAELAYRGKA